MLRPTRSRTCCPRSSFASSISAHKPRRAIEFDPEGDTIPGLFDEFDRICAAVAGRPFRGRAAPEPSAHPCASAWSTRWRTLARRPQRFRPAFRHLALLIQIPGVDIEARMAAEKGAPLDDAERAILDERVRVARAWLESFAPERYRVQVQAEVPAELVAGLSEAQRVFLGALADAADGRAPRRRRRVAGPHLHHGPAPRRVLRGRVRGALRGVPRPAERSTGRLAPGQPRTGQRASSGCATAATVLRAVT